MSKRKQRNVWTALGMIAVAILGAFGQQLAAGQVPLDPSWAWVTPILQASIVAVTYQLRLGSEDEDELRKWRGAPHG